MDGTFTRALSGLIPADEESREWFGRIKLGQLVFAKVQQPRNPLFHRKFFALLKYAFDYWSETAKPTTYRGEAVLPDFDRFRKDITILAGFYHPVVNIRGEVRVEADSIKFASMTEERFEQLYSAVIQALLQRVFTDKTWSEKQLREIVDGLIEFA